MLTRTRKLGEIMSGQTPSSGPQGSPGANFEGMVTCSCGRVYNRKVLRSCPACSNTQTRSTSSTMPGPTPARGDNHDISRLLVRLLEEQEKATRYTRTLMWGIGGVLLLIGLNFYVGVKLR